MVKRYAFWRMPTGQASTRDAQESAPRKLLEIFGSTSFIDGEGRIAWKGFGFDRYRLALHSSIVLQDSEGNELSEADSNLIIWRSIKAAAIKAPGETISPAMLFGLADVEVAAFLRSAKVQHALISSLSMRPCRPR